MVKLSPEQNYDFDAVLKKHNKKYKRRGVSFLDTWIGTERMNYSPPGVFPEST